MKPTEIIMPTKDIDKDKLTEDEKTALLSYAFRPREQHLPPAMNAPVEPLSEEDRRLLTPPGGNPEVTSLPLIRGKVTPGMKPHLPLEAHAATVGVDASLDDVPPMRRAQVLAERAKAAGK
jgi:hypothetical protein